MRRITTLTLNPAIDSACSVAGMRHTRKLRASYERCDPGGGGINVARVVNRLGGRAHAIYLAGDLPIRLVAALHDTSVAMIERYYSRWITDSLEDLASTAAIPIKSEESCDAR